MKQICSWLEEKEQFKGLAYIPSSDIPHLLYLLHEKVQTSAIILTTYHSLWRQHMENLTVAHELQSAFLGAQQPRELTLKMLEMFELGKIKLLFVEPGVLEAEGWVELECDLLVIMDPHLYGNCGEAVERLTKQCGPGRVLALSSSTHTEAHLGLSAINVPKN
jgi:hypothetical protein